MKYIKKHPVLVLLLLIIALPVTITLSRYVKDAISNYIMEAEHFFFNSDKLKVGGTTYTVNNWSGADTFTIQFNLNNMKNNILYSDSDIDYNLSVNCATNTTCSITTASGTILKNEKQDDFTLNITPNIIFSTGSQIQITITATSSSPYIKTLSATFIIKVGRQGISYSITDVANQPYFMVDVTNSRSIYIVRTAFGTKNVNDELTVQEYNALSDTDKAKCSSATITLSFNPNYVILDTTDAITTTSTKSYTTVNNISYISSITFDVDPTSSSKIRFYKKDPTQNYTYPSQNTPIVTFSAI